MGLSALPITLRFKGKMSNFWPGPSAENCRRFLLDKHFWRTSLGTFENKNEEKKSGDKIRGIIWQLENKNPQKSVLPKTDPNNFDAWEESKGCLIKGCMNPTKIPKVGIPKAGIPKTGIPKTGIPKLGIPKVGKTPHWDSPRDRDSKARDSEVRDSENRNSENRDSEAGDSENGRIHGPLNSDTPPCPSIPCFSVLPRKNLKFTKDFLSLPNPQNPW